MKEIRVNGIDVTDRPLIFGRPEQSIADVQVVLTDRINQLTGTVTDEAARPASGATVIVFSTARDQWYPSSRYLRMATSEADGGYSVAGLPFGTYLVAAAPRVLQAGEDAWQDPQLLESLAAHAKQVTLQEGQRQIVNVRMASR